MKFFVVFACALAAVSAHYTQIYHGPQHIPVIGKDGVPEDTLEVQHARADHLAQVAAAQSHGYEYSSYADETPTVSHDVKYVAPVYHGPQHLAVIGKDGVPVDTVEVQHARAEHLLQKAQAEARTVDYKYSTDDSPVAYIDYEHEVPVAKVPSSGYSTHIIHTPIKSHNVGYEQHVPVIIKGGVPMDTAEVQQARATHLAAHAAASHKYHY